MRAGNHVLDVQNGSHLLRNEFAIGVGDAFRLVDKNAQKPAAAAAQQLNVDNFEAFAGADSFGDFLHFCRDFLAIVMFSKRQ